MTKRLMLFIALFENEITETYERWQEIGVVSGLDQRYKSWKTGKSKAYAVEETKAYLLGLKNVKSGK